MLSKGADIHKKDKWGRTPLWEAAMHGRKEIAELLLAKGADVNAGDGANVSPLFVAAKNSDKSIVELLLANGADVNAREEGGLAPLHQAAFYGQKEVIELLLNKGADIDAKSKGGQTPLHAAVLYGHKDSAELLVARGASLDIFTASGLGASDRVKMLLKSDPSLISTRDMNQWRALHWAVRGGHKTVVELLLSNEADVNAKDGRGITPLIIALAWEYKDIADLLRKHGADKCIAGENSNLDYLHSSE